jgi:hypothetical protein
MCVSGFFFGSECTSGLIGKIAQETICRRKPKVDHCVVKNNSFFLSGKNCGMARWLKPGVR